MADLVFVRANRDNVIKEGTSVSFVPSAIGSTGVWSYDRSMRDAAPSGQAVFAQTTLSGRFRNRGYYVGVAGDPADNSGVVIF